MWGLHFRAEDPESQISYVPCLGPTAGDEQGAHGPDRSTCPRRSPAGDQGLPGRDLGTTWGQDGPEATAVVLRAPLLCVGPPPARGAPGSRGSSASASSWARSATPPSVPGDPPAAPTVNPPGGRGRGRGAPWAPSRGQRPGPRARQRRGTGQPPCALQTGKQPSPPWDSIQRPSAFWFSNRLSKILLRAKKTRKKTRRRKKRHRKRKPKKRRKEKEKKKKIR